MRVLVCAKHVPDTTVVRLDPATGQPQLAGVPTKISDYDRHAIQEAARLHTEVDAAVVVLSLGPPDAAKTLKGALASVGDHATLVSGDGTSDLDAAATARVLAAVARREGPFDLMLCGDFSEDKYQGLVPGMLAAELNVPYVSGATRLEVDGDGATVTRVTDAAEEIYRIRWPAVVSVTRAINAPRFVSAVQVMKVPTSKVRTISLADLGIDPSELQPHRLATSVIGLRPIASGERGVMLTGSPEEAVARVLEELETRKVLA